MEEPLLGTLELPTLGRSMHLGTLYDLRNDEAITTGTTLSNKEIVGDRVKVVDQKGLKLNIIRSDSFDDKSVALGLDASLKASVLGGLVTVEAGAKYLHDRQPLDSQCRLTLHVKTSSKFEYLTQEVLEANLKGKTPDVFAQNGKATHVVKSILYGSNTFIVFDYCGGDEKENAVKVLTDLVDKIASSIKDGDDTPDGWDHHIQWKVYSDLPLERNPVDVEGVVQFLTAFPEMSDSKAIPIKVHLYPLGKIDPRSARVCSAVSDSLPAQAQTFLEGIEDCLIRTREMASDLVSNNFPQLKEKFEFFIRLLTEYKSSYKKELARVLPLIRSGSDGEGSIKDMFRDVDSSSFNLTSLNTWVQSKRKELSAVKLYVKFLPDVEIVKSRENLDDIIMDPSIENVVCFTFQLKGREEGYLRALSEYIAERKSGSYEDIQWYDDTSVLKYMRTTAKLFADFFTSNKKEHRTKFILTGFVHAISGSSEGNSGSIGGTVNLFEEGMLTQEDFQPPSKPLKPLCEVIDQYSIRLTWTEPKFGMNNAQRYAVKYNVFRGQNEKTGEPQAMQTTSLENVVTIDNLEPNQSIRFEVSAVCPAGVGPESEPSSVATTLSAKSPEKPEFKNVTASSVSLEWRQPGKMGKDELIESYIIQLMEAGTVIKEVDINSSKKEFKIRNLEANTTYTFQVVALYESGIKSPPSTISDHCRTLPASQPGKPAVGDIKSSSVVITWTGPTITGLGVELAEYFIQYRKVTSRKQSTKSEDGAWEKIVLKEKGASPCVISDLESNTTYVARVTLVCRVKKGKEPVMIPSVISIPFTTLPAGPPSGLKARQISASQIEIRWTKPTVVGTEVKYYKVEYNSDDDPGMVKKKTDNPSCKFVIKGVKSETHYDISVFGFCGNAGAGEVSKVECTTRKLIKEDVSKSSKIIQPGDPETGKPTIFKLPLNKVCEKPQSCSYSFGIKGPTIEREHKVIMLVGVTGSGKSTLINAMVNDILEIELGDEYRFKVVDVDEGNGVSQAHSQTQVLTSYTIEDKNLHLPYTLTIIDTPGFGDTRGINRDKEIFEQIREFFLDAESHGIDHIDAIGFVVQASQVRLTPTQQYVFDAILSVFGKDIAGNIVLLVTFADGKEPPVMAAVKKANIPFTGKVFKFNNSALFAEVRRPNHRQAGNKTSDRKDHEQFDTMFWDMGSKNLKAFFRNVQTLEARSLLLTKEVLGERKRLEAAVQGLQPQIMVGNCKYEALRREQQMLKEHEMQIEANKDFKFKLKVPKSRKVDIMGEYITNCTKCHFTCHYPCYIGEDDKKAGCAAMSDGVCTVCPGKCAWDVHFNQQYRFEFYEEEEEKTYEEIEERYRDASGKKLTVQQVIQKQIESLKRVRTAVFALIAEAHKSVTRLEEIALKPNPLSTVEYIDLLIEAEKSSGKPGWQDRVNSLEDVRKEADIIGKVRHADYDPFEQMEANISGKDKKKKGWFQSWFN